jgi:anti-sigma factor ChrR (cupin superfamily)
MNHDDDLAPRLLAALDPDPPAPGDAALKRRVLRAIAADATPRHLTVPPGDEGWRPFGPGLQRKVLHETGGLMSYLVRLAPGASLPAHRHPVDEECVVLEGEVTIGTLRVAAGGFHLGRQGLPHDRLHSDAGALIFLRGAAPDASHVL